jgi:hypothetical protein
MPKPLKKPDKKTPIAVTVVTVAANGIGYLILIPVILGRVTLPLSQIGLKTVRLNPRLVFGNKKEKFSCLKLIL